MKTAVRQLALFLFFAGHLPAARAWQDTIALPTWLTLQKVDQEWRLLHLENEYLACTFLPDLGGRLYTCFDKRNGKPMFYANPSIKPALIGVRGAGAALGLEMSFPGGHSRATVSPVDFGFRQDAQSAIVWVGAVDRATGMKWRCEFVLRDGVAALEQNVTLSNPTGVRHPYYWWNSAAIELRPGTQFVVPTHEPFFGVYQGDSKTATIHVADPDQAPGKLSDDGSLYVEIQAGLFSTQEQFQFLEPQHARHFTEYWLPARELSGVAGANVDGVLAFQRRTGDGKTELLAELNVTRAMPKARLRILRGTAAVFDQTAALDPSRTFSRVVPDPGAEPYRFELLDDSGKVLLAHTEGVHDADAAPSAKLGPLPAPDRSFAGTASEYLELGNDAELQSRFQEAREAYSEGLRKFPNSAELKKAAGRLAVSQKRYDDAAGLLAGASTQLPADREVNYYLGLVLAAQGKEEEARKQWEAARGDAQFEVPSLLGLAASLARGNLPGEALKRVAEALAKDPSLEGVAHVHAALLRRANSPGPMDEALGEDLAADPERLLDMADEYIGLGMYGEAASLTSRPQNHALVAYYHAYALQQSGSPGADEFRRAATLPVVYEFSNRESSIAVLNAALRANPGDASAHWLLGLLYEDCGRVDEALGEIQKARALRKDLPGLYALRKEEQDEKVQPREGTDALLKESETERMAAAPLAIPLLGTPGPSLPEPGPSTPPLELASLALLRAATGEVVDGLSLFTARGFPQEKQPLEVRRAYIELQLQGLREQASRQECRLAEHGFMAIGEEDTALPFTMYGFATFMKEARFQYYLGDIEAGCGDEKHARGRWSKIARSKESIDTANFAFPALSAARLGEAGAPARLQADAAAVAQRLQSAAAEARGILFYSQGMLLHALHRDEQARAAFRSGSEAPDRQESQYLNFLVLREMTSAQ